jgi:tight adherence protein C
VAVLLALGALACLTVAAMGLRQVLAPPDVGSLATELRPDDERERQSLIVATYAALGRWSGPTIARLLGPKWRSWVQGQLDAGGRPRDYDVAGYAEFQGAYAVLALLSFVLMLVQGRLGLALALTALLLIFPTVWLISQAQRRQRLIERDLPDFLDILAVTVTAGLSFRQALDRVSETLDGPLAEEMQHALRRMDVGVGRRQAFVDLRERNPRSATMGLFTAAILQAEELGAPLADTLNQLAKDMRREFAQSTRRRAARAAPRVSLIITMVILPAVVLLIVVALVLGSNLDLGAL